MTHLHHIALGAHDVAALAGFYQNLLNLPELARHHDPQGQLRSIWLDLSPGILMIEGTDDPPRHVEAIGAGPFLLAFTVSPEQRLPLEARLQNAGTPIEARTDFTSYFRDPEGNRLAISHYPQT